MSTVGYRLATKNDVEKALDFAKQEGMELKGFEFPTILAVEDEEIVGILGTSIINDMVIAGPLLMRSDKRRRWAILRLIEMYDHTMRALGIKSYIHSVEDSNKKWLDFIKKVYGTEPYAKENGHHFFVKRLTDVQPEGRSSGPLVSREGPTESSG